MTPKAHGSAVGPRAAYVLFLAFAVTCTNALASEPKQFSGIYPHLAMFNDEGECGTGAVVPWADRLWVITYGPHLPHGSSDKLYEITGDLNQLIRPESIGGTPADRLIHAESNQLFIGPYAIDADRRVRAIPSKTMPGRLTGAARHLTDPAIKIYIATMEEGIYEVDVKSLAVRELYPDTNGPDGKPPADGGTLLPGYHGKGLYSGQGRLIYANNGENSPEAKVRPDIESGALAEWNGKDWHIVRRNQFTDVTGPGGIFGNKNPATDPIWSIGWDHRSLILMLLDGGTWHTFRLPKASHCYDGAHGWNTEWPRIREIGEGDDLLMTMHGMFWRFPRTFSAKNSAGIAPRSTYLKVVGDFCRWSDRIVLGCDDTAQRDFLNKRAAKGNLAGPGQSQSNLWFVEPMTLDHLGPATGSGGVWLDEPLRANTPSDPFLFAGFERRALHLAHAADAEAEFRFEIDRSGNGTWTLLRSVKVPPHGYQWVEFSEPDKAAWIRISVDRDCPRATAMFTVANNDRRPTDADRIFRALARYDDPNDKISGGLLRARGENKRTLQFAAIRRIEGKSQPIGSYELDADMILRPMKDAKADDWLRRNAAVPQGILTSEPASLLYVDDAGKRWRLPKAIDEQIDPLDPVRVDREVVTERDLFNAGGIFYELPADNAGGFAKIRPIAAHQRRIHDYCSWRGLLVMSGIADARATDDAHVIRSTDGKCALWVGSVDDLWKLGRPGGEGGPWLDTTVKKDEPSDPYLVNGFDRKTLTLRHNEAGRIKVRVEVDITGTGLWQPYKTLDVPSVEPLQYEFPRAFCAYWLRLVSDHDAKLTAQFRYD